MSEDDDDTGEPDNRKYLDALQTAKYLNVVTDLDHIVILRLLLNGISVKNILKIRPKDVKYRLTEIKLVSEARKVAIDRPTMNLIEQYMAKHQFWTKDTCRLFGTDTSEDYTARKVRAFVQLYGQIADFQFSVSPKTLQNTYFIIIMTNSPEVTVEEIHQHIGHSKLSYTQELFDFYKNEIKKLKGKK